MILAEKTILRHDGRSCDQMRPMYGEHAVFEWAAGSVLLTCGKTKILCAVNIQNGVPEHQRGTGCGWLTAEYALLPASTKTRTSRPSPNRPDGRSLEISRLIGRSLRAVLDLSVLGERTIIVDCDVLQADGSTRVTSITAASLALQEAQNLWLANGVIKQPFIKQNLCGISVGVLDGQIILDPDFREDKQLSADFNFIMTPTTSTLIEVQGGSEKSSITWQQFDHIRDFAIVGARYIADLFFSSGQKSESYKAKEKQFVDNQKLF